MSRTIKKVKPMGYEFWSARPGNKHGGSTGKEAKKITASIEREISKRIIEKELKDSLL